MANWPHKRVWKCSSSAETDSNRRNPPMAGGERDLRIDLESRTGETSRRPQASGASFFCSLWIVQALRGPFIHCYCFIKKKNSKDLVDVGLLGLMIGKLYWAPIRPNVSNRAILSIWAPFSALHRPDRVFSVEFDSAGFPTRTELCRTLTPKNTFTLYVMSRTWDEWTVFQNSKKSVFDNFSRSHSN